MAKKKLTYKIVSQKKIKIKSPDQLLLCIKHIQIKLESHKCFEKCFWMKLKARIQKGSYDLDN